MRAVFLHMAHNTQRTNRPQPHHQSRRVDGDRLARRVVAGCVTVLLVLAAAVALPMPTGG
jgi:hypothetical protein